MARILVVDDEPSIVSVLKTLLAKQGYEVVPSEGGEHALERVRKESFDLLLSDIRMAPVDGLTLLREMRRANPETAIVLLTGHGSIKTAVEAMRHGAFDYVTKPFKVDELLATVERALDYRRAMGERRGLHATSRPRYRLDNIVAESEGMIRVCDMIERVAGTDVTVLIVGESGTGKEVVARAIHQHSLRRDKPFVPINCAALPEPLLESEFFGHVKGAFTGATEDKVGLFEMAAAGTVFLDEIGGMPLSMQAKLLRVLQDKHIRRVGGTETYPVDARIIAATNEPLERSISRKLFREDLFYRISVIPIEIPPLRQRREDILPLAAGFVERDAPGGALTLDGEVERLLLRYDWPGNVRELENAIRHAVTFADDGVLRKEALPTRVLDTADIGMSGDPALESGAAAFRGRSLKAFLRAQEKAYLKSVIERMGGDKLRAAKALNISLATLYRKLPDAESARAS